MGGALVVGMGMESDIGNDGVVDTQHWLCLQHALYHRRPAADQIGL
jgi:hypothetical protein